MPEFIGVDKTSLDETQASGMLRAEYADLHLIERLQRFQGCLHLLDDARLARSQLTRRPGKDLLKVSVTQDEVETCPLG